MDEVIEGLKEIAAAIGVKVSQVVMLAKRGEVVNGYEIVRDEDEDGRPAYTAILVEPDAATATETDASETDDNEGAANEETPEDGEKSSSIEITGQGEITEETSELVETGDTMASVGVPSRMVSAMDALCDDGESEPEKLQRLIMLCDGRTRNDARDALMNIDGVGKSTAGKTVDALKAADVWQPAEAEPDKEPDTSDFLWSKKTVRELREEIVVRGLKYSREDSREELFLTLGCLPVVCPGCDLDYGWTDPKAKAYAQHPCVKSDCGIDFIVERKSDGAIVVTNEKTGETVEVMAKPDSEETASTDAADATEEAPQQDAEQAPDAEETQDAPPREAQPEPDEESVSVDSSPDPADGFELPPVRGGIENALYPEAVSVGSFAYDSPKWHQARTKGIGSSDVAAILGLSDFGNIVDVFESKVDPGKAEDPKPWLDEYRDFGTFMEPYILRACEQAGEALEIRTSDELGTLKSRRWTHALANCDGIATDLVIEEIKTSEREWKELPDSHYVQVQHQMFVTGLDRARVRQFISPLPRAHFGSLRAAFGSLRAFPFEDEADDTMAAWLLGAGEIVTWIVNRDDDFIGHMVQRELEFWDCVYHGIVPEIPTPEGEADLSNNLELVEAFDRFAKANASAKQFKPIMNKARDAKSSAKRLLEREIAVVEGSPKRVRVGHHKATLTEREGAKNSWTIYPGELA